MYIENKYWNNLIGDTDDSLMLVEYLAGKQTETIPVGEIFSDFGLDKLQGDFKTTSIPLLYADPEGWEMEIKFAIDLIADLAALLLECKVSGSLDMQALLEEPEPSFPALRLTATPEEHAQIDAALADFASAPLRYDLSELCPEEDMQELAALCGDLRRELYG